MKVILSINSEIGSALAKNWIHQGHIVVGTYRKWNEHCVTLKSFGVKLFYCNLLDSASVSEAATLITQVGNWETLVLSAGDQNPIGLFHETNFLDWENSIKINFTSQVAFLNILMATSHDSTCNRTVIFFAGGGTNNATERYSAYTISKIASIKLCELLDFEYENYKFVCVGPGWVESKIHDATIAAKNRAGKNYEKTLSMFSEKLMNPVENVVKCCEWILESPKIVVGGRNFSVVNDSWGSTLLDKQLIQDRNYYKLRRYGNDFRF